MLIDNLGPAFRISLVPGIAYFLLSYLVAHLVLIPWLQNSADGEPNSLIAVILLFAGVVSTIVLLCLVAVAWHRYVLVEEHPRPWGPKWNGPEITNYFFASVRMIGGTMLIAVPLLIVFGVLSGLSGQGGFDNRQGGPLAFAFNVAIGYFSVRFSLALPAAAVGSYMRVFDSLRATKPFAGAVFIACLLITLLTHIPNLLIGTLIESVLAGFAYFAIAGWLQIMLSVSLLTALYGHIVEGRDLR